MYVNFFHYDRSRLLRIYLRYWLDVLLCFVRQRIRTSSATSAYFQFEQKSVVREKHESIGKFMLYLNRNVAVADKSENRV